MYELSRVRLHTVGPPGARYRNVTLDFRGVGPRLRSGAQASLFGETDAQSTPDSSGPEAAPSTSSPAALSQDLHRRPSPASVLFLENGGGKSVLIKLIFSVMLPGRRQVVGSTNTKVLEKFVQANEVAHVVLEWQHTQTEELRITGKVSEWRGHSVSADPRNLLDRWYSFRPTPTLNLDNLPFTQDGRLLTLSAFHERLKDAQHADSKLRLAWEQVQSDWTAHLADIGLDPRLFGYQRAMNAGEGEAADIFAFHNDQAFVDFLLKAVTDHEVPREVADVLVSYASKLATRSGLLIERDFVAGALEALEPLQLAQNQAEQARQGHTQVRAEVEDFLGQVARRHQREQAHVATAEAATQAARQLFQKAEQERDRLSDIAQEMRRRVAKLRLAQAEQRSAEISAQLEQARLEQDSWRSVPTVLEFHTSRENASYLRQAVAETEDQARPLLLARTRAQRALARALRSWADHADRESLEANQAANRAFREAQRWDSERENALSSATQQEARLEEAQRQLAEIHQALQDGVAAGLLPAADAPTSRAADSAVSPNSNSRAAQAQREAEDAATALKRELATADETLNQLSAALGSAHETAARARHEQQRAQTTEQRAREALEAGQAKARTLTGSERLVALLGAESVELDTDTAALLGTLQEALANAEQRLTELSSEDTRDRAALNALGTGGLLPDPPDIARAIGALSEASIPCYSGWRYLSKKDSEAQQALLNTHPHLVDGVVLTNPDHLDRAREVLQRARLLPVSVIAVGSTRSLDSDNAALSGVEGIGTTSTANALDSSAEQHYIVPPNPAMYDEEAAEREREQIATRVEARQAEMTALRKQRQQDQTLVHELTVWQRDFPPGTLAELQAAHEGASQEFQAARDTTEAAAEQLEQARAAETHHREAVLPELRQQQSEAAERARATAELARKEANIPQWESQRAEATPLLDAAQLRAEEAKEQAAHTREEGYEHRRAADAHQRTAAECRAELGSLQGAIEEHDDASTLDTPSAERSGTDASAATGSLDQLRATARQAEENYRAAQVPGQLHEDLRRAEEAEQRAREAYLRLNEPIARRAEELLSTSDGASAPSRETALQRITQRIQRLSDDNNLAQRHLGECHNVLAQLPSNGRGLGDYGEPRDIAHGDQLVERVDTDHQAARLRRQTAEAELQRRQHDEETLRARRTAFAHLSEPIDDLRPPALDDQATAESAAEDPLAGVFSGDAEDAQRRREKLREQLQNTAAQRQERERVVQEAAHQLHRYAHGEQFVQAESTVRRQIISTAADRLPLYAHDWAQALRPRLRILTDELEHLDRHRSAIVERLRGMVRSALSTLRAAQRLSCLPEGLGDWSGQEFLRISFQPAEESQLAERIGAVVDELAAEAAAEEPGNASSAARTAAKTTGSGKRNSGLRDGVSLLLRGVHAAVPQGFRVEMLKPDAVLRTERLRVSEVRDVFSGGQQLTAAIVLYCTLAALRGNERGSTKRQHSGVLFLDNPLGRASAGYLLDIQLAVASALGVQLVYTTGIFDASALSVFPLIIRLRNDADLRAGKKYLSVESTQRPYLDQLAPDGQPQIDATRIFRRTADPATTSTRAAAEGSA